ncbi:MAG: hypothetical protein JSS35_07095, partial [Proteobacteria bacterium]|nr:hypothetical protein [Pseudomonadota bacterium]
FEVAATGSLAGVGSIYISQASPAAPADAVASGLRQAGIAMSPLRCARDPARPDRSRGWYHISAGRAQGNLYVGPLSSGRQGYTIFLGDLPPMTQAEVANFVDCPDGRPAPTGSGAPQTGQAGVVAVIEALLRPAGAPTRLAWRTPLPAIRWNTLGPQKIGRPEFAFGGADKNPQVLDGVFKTPTTEMTVTATGDPAGANRFYLEGGGHLPREAVFNALRRDGYSIDALICGKPYTKMSENWFRISAPGKQPAILYRSMCFTDTAPTENYAIRLDNAPPAIQPGQRAANGGACPG